MASKIEICMEIRIFRPYNPWLIDSYNYIKYYLYVSYSFDTLILIH